MPLRSDYADQSCALARALAILGERWTLLIVRDAFHGLTRYDEFLRSLGLATNVLSARLQKLVEHGVLERTAPRGSYHLTQKGRDLLILHNGCDREAGGALRCEHCGDPITLRDLRVVPAPGAVGSDGEPTALTPPQQAAWGGRSASH